MSILNQLSIIYLNQSYSVSGRTPIVAEIWSADSSDLPSATEFDGYNLCSGCKATCANGDIYRYDGTQWVYNEQSPFKDVYTKTAVNTITDAIEANVSNLQVDVGDIQTADTNQDAYIFALIGQSSLNYVPNTAWEGATTAGSGYICQDLAISLPAGNYVWKMKRDGNTSTSLSIRDASNNVLYSVTRGAGVNDITQKFTISADAAKVSIYAGYSINFSQNMIFKDLSTSSNRSLRLLNQINEEVDRDREEDIDRDR